VKKFIFVLTVLAVGTAFVYAQEESAQAEPQQQEEAQQEQAEPQKAQDQQPVAEKRLWKTSGILSWAYSQTAVSDNWTGKERFSRMWQGKLFLSTERDSEKSNWLTTIKEEYGESDTESTSDISLDYLEFNTVYTYKVFKLLQPYASFYTQSQNNVFWDPVTYIESVGLSFTVFENEINTLKLRGGGALKQIDDSIRGNERSAGAEAIMNYDLLFHKDAKFVSEARLYETFKDGEDFRWENKLFLRTGPWFTTEFGYKVYFENARIASHHWPDDIETMIYVALGLSFNMFQN
jgi:Protein of unknown function, DUF481.